MSICRYWEGLPEKLNTGWLASFIAINSMEKNSKKTYWVTGASSGIGKQIALKLSSAGHRVVLTSRSREQIEKLASSDPEHFIALPADVSNEFQLENLFESLCISEIDGAFLSAGICEYVDVPEWDIPSIKRVMSVNFHGVVNSCMAALPLLVRSKKNNPDYKPFIVGISSMSTYIAFPRAEAYGASKTAMAYFLNSLRTDIQSQVDVTVVYPGFVDTRLTEANDFAMPTMVSAEYAANIILKKMNKRPRKIVFPLGLHYLLKIAAILPGIWYRFVIPRLSRARMLKL